MSRNVCPDDLFPRWALGCFTRDWPREEALERLRLAMEAIAPWQDEALGPRCEDCGRRVTQETTTRCRECYRARAARKGAAA